MKISVEMSLYPLADEYLPSIKGTVERLNAAQDVLVKTNAMSTQIVGEYDRVMALINTEMKRSFEEIGKAVFVCKFINSALDI